MGLYDAFESKDQAVECLRSVGFLYGKGTVRKGNFGDNGRLKWGVFLPKF